METSGSAVSPSRFPSSDLPWILMRSSVPFSAGDGEDAGAGARGRCRLPLRVERYPGEQRDRGRG